MWLRDEGLGDEGLSVRGVTLSEVEVREQLCEPYDFFVLFVVKKCDEGSIPKLRYWIFYIQYSSLINIETKK
jgi:hypothetical protein